MFLMLKLILCIYHFLFVRKHSETGLKSCFHLSINRRHFPNNWVKKEIKEGKAVQIFNWNFKIQVLQINFRSDSYVVIETLVLWISCQAFCVLRSYYWFVCLIFLQRRQIFFLSKVYVAENKQSYANALKFHWNFLQNVGISASWTF